MASSSSSSSPPLRSPFPFNNRPHRLPTPPSSSSNTPSPPSSPTRNPSSPPSSLTRNPSSPPPSPTRNPSSPPSSPTGNNSSPPPSPTKNPSSPRTPSNQPYELMSPEDRINAKRRKIQERVDAILSDAPFKDPKWGASDLNLVLVSIDRFWRTEMKVHRKVLTEKSGFFAENLMLDEKPIVVHNSDYFDIYVEAVVLMYCEDLKKKLRGVDFDRTLRLLNLSKELQFAAGEQSCLKHLEAIPWTEEEGKKVVSLLGRFDETHPMKREILRRLTRVPSTSSGVNDIILRLMNSVLDAENVKGRRDMKSLLSRLFKIVVVSEEVLNQLCQKCLTALEDCSKGLASMDASNINEVLALKSKTAKEVDNLFWLVEIMIDKKLGDEFVKKWANQKELADLHEKIPQKHSYGISRLTAHLCTSIARRFILAPRESRYSLLDTWLEALYAEFESMMRDDRNFDRNSVEEGLCATILTLSLGQQQRILFDWFDRFVNKDDDCPDLQQAFAIWWRRAFLSDNAAGAE